MLALTSASSVTATSTVKLTLALKRVKFMEFI